MHLPLIYSQSDAVCNQRISESKGFPVQSAFILKPKEQQE
jgi:hypothetical protein|tara:strand:- start:1076 stop:1195 length:120 start_codon:yes stop_codon:yes gene_type:complete